MNKITGGREHVYVVESPRERPKIPEISANRSPRTCDVIMDNVKASTEQLRVEAQLVRKKVSEVSKDLMDYCEKNKGGDMLVSGPTDQHNPFQEKKSCNVL